MAPIFSSYFSGCFARLPPATTVTTYSERNTKILDGFESGQWWNWTSPGIGAKVVTFKDGLGMTSLLRNRCWVTITRGEHSPQSECADEDNHLPAGLKAEMPSGAQGRILTGRKPQDSRSIAESTKCNPLAGGGQQA